MIFRLWRLITDFELSRGGNRQACTLVSFFPAVSAGAVAAIGSRDDDGAARFLPPGQRGGGTPLSPCGHRAWLPRLPQGQKTITKILYPVTYPYRQITS